MILFLLVDWSDAYTVSGGVDSNGHSYFLQIVLFFTMIKRKWKYTIKW